MVQDNNGTCLCDESIKQLIKNKKLITKKLGDKQIQPASFELSLSDKIIILETGSSGLFRPRKNKTVKQILDDIPKSQNFTASIKDGFEIKKGFTYLIPLNEKVVLEKGEYIKSSPKSSFGRLFVQSRLVADYNPCFDEVTYHYKTGEKLELYLLVEPLTFNLIIYPGLALNQVRFFRGYNTQMTPLEIDDIYKEKPLLLTRKDSGEITKTKPIITDGLIIHLDISGKHSNGLIGFRAKNNPIPIDTQKEKHHDLLAYFEPIYHKNKSFSIKKGEHYLLFSKEILDIPSDVNIELKTYSHVGLNGPLHFAGFIDNGFFGDLVFEVRSDEKSDMILDDGMPISKLDVFKTEMPNTVYGEEIGSNYKKQIGPKPSKFFKMVSYEKLKELSK